MRVMKLSLIPRSVFVSELLLEGGFQNTQELHVKKYKEATNGPAKDKWEEAVFDKHDIMVKNQVCRAVPNKDVPKHYNIMSSTWATKKKSNGTYCARFNTRGYDQFDGQH
jgi:hypothetical protein